MNEEPDLAVRSSAPPSSDTEPPGAPVDVTVVMPCLNEADTLAECILRAKRGLELAGVTGEVLVADNGSTDGSLEIASKLGARVIRVAARGYGSALMEGIRCARGKWIIMGDADASYDFEEAPQFTRKLAAGFELVQGCRLPSGGGRVLPGAMPFLHRWWGNPMFSLMARWWFRAPIHDVYCGLRAFTKELQQRLGQRCTGMEFATEMIIRAAFAGARIAEVPITLHPDGRKAHAPHLKTFRDGWRTLRLFLLYSPRWLFLIPGIVMLVLGLIGYGLALPGANISGVKFDAHTLLLSSLLLLCAYQSILFAVFTKTFGVNEGLLAPDPRLQAFYRVATLERGLIAGGLALLAGSGLILVTVVWWCRTGFGQMDYPRTMRLFIPGTMLVALAFQTILSSFFVSILGLGKR